MRATAFAPGSVGNVGPGFDVLGLAVEGIGDRVTVELASEGPSEVVVRGRDAELVPADPERNCAVVAARALLRALGLPDAVRVTVEKGLALAGGMGGSAASSVAGAWAAHLAAEATGEPGATGGVGATGEEPEIPRSARDDRARSDRARSETARDAPVEVRDGVLAAAFAAESAVAGPHLDNVAASLLGGLALSLGVDPPDAVALPVGAEWWVALVTPAVRVETRAARALLPERSERAAWVRQMASTVALAHAFATGDGALLSRALDDRFAEPVRAAAIPGFSAVKRAALDAGAFGGSISGSGPTVFAIAPDEAVARRCAAAMREAFAAAGVASAVHAGAIARHGVRRA